MKLLANENFPIKSVDYLKAGNFDIKAIGIDNPSIKDSAVMEIAIQEERTILTFDRDQENLFSSIIINQDKESFICGLTTSNLMSPEK